MSRPAIAPEALAGFTALARALCDDRRIVVETGARAHFDPTRHAIGIDVDSASEPERARGILAHECGHVLITRYHLWKPPTPWRGIWFTLLNTLEDPRVDGWMIRRYPGSRPWFDAIARHIASSDVALPTSLFRQFILVAAGIDPDGRSHLEQANRLHPVAIRTFDMTRDMRRRYCDTVPVASLASPPMSWESEIRLPLDAEGDGVEIDSGDALETSIRRCAHAAWRIARDEVLPAVQPLIDRDVARIVAFARRDAAVDRALAHGDRTARVAAVRAALAAVPPDAGADRAAHLGDDARWRNAMRAFDDFVADLHGSTQEDGGSGDGPGGRGTVEPSAESDDAEPDAEGPLVPRRGADFDYGEIQRRIRPQVRDLRDTLEAIMVDRRRPRWRSGFRSGSVPDLRRLMRFEADRRDDRVWQRMLRNRAREGVVGLLVDLSGSMARSGKIEAAVAGTLLLAEAASGAQIDFLIDGFQDVLIPVAAIGERCTPAVRQRIGEMALEVVNRRPGGNNVAGNNDDGPCLDAFAGKLTAGAGRRNLLLVISDGVPEGAHSTPDDLRRSVTRLAARPDLTLIGLGLGTGTRHVRDYYPVAVADVPVDRLGEEIGRIVQRHCRAL